MSEKKWHAVYTKVRWEKKVADILSKRNIENYCPINRVVKQWSDRKKTILEPLFTSYVFVRVTAAEHIQLLRTDGVINLVYWLGKPAVIRDHEIEMIQRFLSEHNEVSLEKIHVNVNDLVRVISGPLMNHEGHVVAVKSNTVKIILPSLGFAMSAEVEIGKVEIARERYSYFGLESSRMSTS
ncbi:UpxY family transcription antiterminator [Flavitalea antarctica]